MKYFTDTIMHQMAAFLGRDDIFSQTFNTEPLQEYTTTPERDLMLESINFTARELAEVYFPLTRVESKTTDAECKVLLSSFDKKLLRILQVLDNRGRNTTFRVFDDFIKLCEPSAGFEFVYEYTPQSVKHGGYIEAVSCVSERIIAIGACATFCLASGMYEEAKMWDERFKIAIEKIKRKGSIERRVPKNM